MSRSCVECGCLITGQNDSREHVLPRAIGGRLQTRGFLCTACNSKAGQNCDAEAARQLNALSLFFGIKRQGGDPPSQKVNTVSGQELWLGPGGRLGAYKPEISVKQTPLGTQYIVKARSHEESRQILEGLKRKHPQIDVEKHLSEAQTAWSSPDGPVMFSLTFGGNGAHRSAIKSAAAYAHRVGISHDLFDTAKAYLRGEPVGPPIGYYHDSDLVQGRPAGVPIHCVAVKGSPETGLLLGYVEYFGFQRCVVCLSEHYTGPSVNKTYAIDPLTGLEVAVSIDLPFGPADLTAIYNYERLPIDAMREALANVLPTGLKRQAEAERGRQLKDALDYAWANCGARPGEMLTPEHLWKISGMMAKKLSPYLLRQIIQQRSRHPAQFVRQQL